MMAYGIDSVKNVDFCMLFCKKISLRFSTSGSIKKIFQISQSFGQSYKSFKKFAAINFYFLF